MNGRVFGGQVTNPYSTFFSVSNQSPIPIRNMRIGCAVPLVYYDDKYVKEELHGDTWFGNPELFRDSDDGVSLDPYGQHSFRCESILSVQIHGQLVMPTRVRLIVQSGYNLFFLPWPRIWHKQYFDSFKDASGNLHWTPTSKWNPRQPDFPIK